MNPKQKRKVLEYLKSCEELAAAPGYAIDHKTGKYTQVELMSFGDGIDEWTSEDIFNLEYNNEVFNKDLFERIIRN